MRARYWIIAALLVAALAAGGYLLGASEAPSEREAAEAREQARVEAAIPAREAAEAQAERRGLVAGERVGDRRGKAAGQDRGDSAGSADAEAELVAQAEAAEAAEEAAALAEAQERAANCGAPLFVDGYCPTDEEIARENAAEALCGPGTPEGREEAAALGIQC